MNVMKLLRNLSTVSVFGIACLIGTDASAQTPDLSIGDPTITPECDSFNFQVNGITLTCPDPIIEQVEECRTVEVCVPNDDIETCTEEERCEDVFTVTNRSIIYFYDVTTAGPSEPQGDPAQCACNYQVHFRNGIINPLLSVVLKRCDPNRTSEEENGDDVVLLQLDEEDPLPPCEGILPTLAEPPTENETGQGSNPYSCTTGGGSRNCSQTQNFCDVFPCVF